MYAAPLDLSTLPRSWSSVAVICRCHLSVSLNSNPRIEARAGTGTRPYNAVHLCLAQLMRGQGSGDRLNPYNARMNIDESPEEVGWQGRR